MSGGRKIVGLSLPREVDRFIELVSVFAEIPKSEVVVKAVQALERCPEQGLEEAVRQAKAYLEARG